MITKNEGDYFSVLKNADRDIFPLINCNELLKLDDIDYESNYETIHYKYYGISHVLPYRINRNKNKSREYNKKDIRSHLLDTRSVDGLDRERALRILFGAESVYNAPMAIFLSCEYVIEIIDIIYHNYNKINKYDINNFFIQNDNAYKFIDSRIKSYWNCYYRFDVEWENYVGKSLLDRIADDVRFADIGK